MIIQGSPDILRGPQGLNGFGDFGLTDSEIREAEYEATLAAGLLKQAQERAAREAAAQESAYQEQIRLQQEAAAREVAYNAAYARQLKEQEDLKIAIAEGYANAQAAIKAEADAKKAADENGGYAFDGCGTGGMMVDGVCVGDPSTYGPVPGLFPEPIPMPVPPKPQVLMTNNIFPGNVDETGRPMEGKTGISPVLILAAVAAYFIAG